MPDIYTAAQIIAKIDRKYRTPASNASKLDYINEAIERLYRDIGFDDIHEIETQEDVFMYAIPSDMKFENIKTLTVSLAEEDYSTDDIEGQKQYRAAAAEEDLSAYCYFKVIEGYIGIHPRPKTDGQIIRIDYQKDSSNVSSVDDEIYLRGDYIKAIVYYVCMEFAEDNDDIAKRNNFNIGYNDEITRIKSDEYEKDGKFPVCKDTRIKDSSRTRRNVALNRSTNGRYFTPKGGW